MANKVSVYSIAVLRLTRTGAITAVLVFVLCWVGASAPFSSPTHAYISLFTPADVKSVSARVESGIWPFLFGALSAAVVGLLSNLFVGFEPESKGAEPGQGRQVESADR
jgi:hypothetical protein